LEQLTDLAATDPLWEDRRRIMGQA